MKTSPLLVTFFRRLLGVVITLVISTLISAIIVLYTPFLFKWTFAEVAEILAAYKDIDMTLYEDEDFRTHYQVPDTVKTNVDMYEWLATQNPEHKKINTIFSRGLLVRLPEDCRYIIYGRHKTIDLHWVIEGGHCKQKGHHRLKSDQKSDEGNDG